MRHAVLVAAVVSALTSAGSLREDLALVLAFGLDAAGHVLVRSRPGLAKPFIAIDAVVLVMLAGVGVPAWVVLMLGVAMLAWAVTYRPAAAVAAYSGVQGAVWLVFARSVDLAPVWGFIGFSALGAIFVIRMIRLNMAARQATEREHLVAVGVDAIVWEADPDHAGAFKVSAAAERLLGYPVESFTDPEFIGHVIHPDDRDLMSVLRDPREAKGAVTVRIRRADGTYRWFENHTSIVGDRRRGTQFVVGVLLDRTDQLAAERNALALGHLMSSSPIGQIMLRRVNGEPVVEAVNQACAAVLGTTTEAIGTKLTEAVDAVVAARLLPLLLTEGEVNKLEIEGINGRTYEATVHHLDPESCSVDFLDVTERIQHASKLHRQGRQDELTGLTNRRGLIEALERRLHEQPNDLTTLILIDLDDFKEVNDSLGHETGDFLLAEIAGRLARAAQRHDVAARLGGDEFALLLAGVSPEHAMHRAADIIDVVREPVELGDLRLRVRASIGIAGFPDDAGDSSELMRRADVAMYTAKARGSNIERYDPSADLFDRDRLALVAELEDAIANDELVLFHQPLLDVATGRVVGTEALVRWQHPRFGMLPPVSFIELAEVSGLIRPLTRWVVRRALIDIATIESTRGDHLTVSVNLSVRNLYEHDLIDWLRATLTELGVPPSRLIIEITESLIMDDQGIALEVLEGLRALGVRAWIDDFGTGHSSFSRLRELPVDGVKIDRSFVSGGTERESDRIILRSIIELVHSLGLETIAEGVEDFDHIALLEALNCRTAQGYFIAKPMPFAALTDYLAIGFERPAVPFYERTNERVVNA